jgi:predicted DCC family thiol-disulfide oxidoreductase YuxK
MDTATAKRALPDRVGEPPATPTVLYDGQCRICTASADRIRALDTERRLELLSLHDPNVAARFPEIHREEVLEQMHLIERSGEVLRGADAVRGVLRRLPRLRWLGLLWLVPGFAHLAHVGYGWVARNRYRFNRHVTCDGSVCHVRR